MADRPTNPYKRGTLIWSLMEGGLQEEFDSLPRWSDLDMEQIAEVMGATYNSINTTLLRITRETGYTVKRARKRQYI